MAENTRELPRAEWAAYLRVLAARAEGARVSVELLSAELGDQALTEGLALRSITFVARPGQGTLELDLGEGAEVDHRVVAPRRIFAIEDAAGGLICLDVEDAAGAKTLIRLERPLLIGAGARLDEAPAGVRVDAFMSAPVRTLPVGSSLAQAYAVLQAGGFRHLPIVEPDGSLRGLLSDRELFLAKYERGIAPDDVTVDEVMARSPFHVSPDTPIEEVAMVMARRKYGCAVVVEGSRVAGILTTTDALRALTELAARQRTEGIAGLPSPAGG